MDEGLAIWSSTKNLDDERYNGGIISGYIGYFWVKFHRQNPVLFHRQMPAIQIKKNKV